MLPAFVAPCIRESGDYPPAPMTAPQPEPAPRTAGFQRRDWLLLGALLAAFALFRLPVFPYAENLYGDAVVRAELAERWANEPRLYRSFQDGVYQFGPLHFYAMGAALKAWPSREHATRLVSLLLGLLVVVPVYRIGRRVFSRRAAVVAGLSMAAWGLHVQASTTAASEAVFLTLFLFAVDHLLRGLDEDRFAPLAVSALLCNLCCALRYDAWMYAPLLGAAIALRGTDRLASLVRAALFLGLCAPYPLWWMHESEKASGDPLFALHYIDAYHTRWVQDGVAWLGEPLQRLSSALFWPGTMLVTCSLFVGLFALAGVTRALVQRRQRTLALLALAPVALYAFKGAVLLNFVPLARFFMVPAALALFYVDDGFDWLCGRLGPTSRRALAGVTAATAVGFVLWLGWFTAWKTGPREDTLRPIAPLSTMPVDQMQVARFLGRSATGDGLVILDEAPEYTDINVGFFTGLPENRLARRRWENFEKQLRELPEPGWLFAARGGALEKAGVPVGAPELTWRNRSWRQVLAASDTLFVYQRL